MSKQVSRRDVLKTSAVLASGYWLGVGAPSAFSKGPNEKLNVACIGIGGRGGANVGGVSSENMIAFADVDDKRAEKSLKKYPNVKTYRDYRKMFDQHGKELDAVVISTPDHTHFHPAYTAMQMGLHVYLEKPLAHNVWETRTLTDLAKKKKLATQLGSQRHAASNMHRVVELIQSGAIGPVTEVYSWVGGGRGMPAMPEDTPAVPEHLDYDLWVGPAKFRPYHPSFCPYGWRFWWDYGTGETGNWGCHILDIPFWALGLTYPTRVDGSGPDVDPHRTPKSMETTFNFPARGKQPPVTLHWSHGKTPKIFAEKKLSSKGANTLFIGEKGMLVCGFGSHKLYPEEQFADFKAPEKFIPDSPGFHKEWIMACKGGDPATCNFDYSGPLAETVLLGNLAYRAGGFDWNAKNLKAKGNPAAEPFIREAYRKGWELS